MVVIADPGDALFASSELFMRRQTEYLSPAYYTSMGFAVPAALGVMVARPKLRPIVLVGDGAFQMTGMELSSVLRNGFCPVVIVLDNEGYGTERMLLPGDHPFNDVRPWHYSKLPEVLGGGKGHEVRSEGEFDQALASALADPRQMHLLHVHLGFGRLQPDARAIDDETPRLRVRPTAGGGEGGIVRLAVGLPQVQGDAVKYESSCGFGESIDHLPDLRSIFAVGRLACSLPLCAGNAGADASLSALCGRLLSLRASAGTPMSARAAIRAESTSRR